MAQQKSKDKKVTDNSKNVYIGLSEMSNLEKDVSYLILQQLLMVIYANA